MSDNWRSNIGAYLSGAGSNRTKFIEKQLSAWFKEYADYLKEFDGISAEISHYVELEDERYYIQIEVYVKSIDPAWVAPFILAIRSENAALEMKYAIDFDFPKAVHAKCKADPYHFKDEIFAEAEIHQKEYVLELINKRFILFIEKIKSEI